MVYGIVANFNLSNIGRFDYKHTVGCISYPGIEPRTYNMQCSAALLLSCPSTPATWTKTPINNITCACHVT